MDDHGRAFLVSVLLMLSLGTATAQDNKSNIELQRKLYAELAAILTVDVGDQQRSGTFLMLNPAGGTLLDPNIDVSDNFQRSILVNGVADIRLRESWITSQRPGSMASIYRAILRDRRTPAYTLNAAEKAEFEAIDQDLYDGRGARRRESIFLKTYRDAEAALVLAIGRVEAFQKENPGRTVPKSLSADLQLARDKFNNDAQGPTVRQLLMRHTELQRRRGSAWMADLEDQFDRNYNSADNFGEVRFYPTYPVWFDKDKTWTKITITSTDLEKRTHNTSTSFSGGISGGWGLWSWGGRYEKDEESKSNQSKASNLRLTFEVLAVQVRYPWMDFGVFESRAWDWSRSAMYYGIPLSDGTYAPDSPASDTELLPLVPTAILIARNVEMSADWDFKLEEFFRMRESASGSVGWGPFSVGGRRNRTDESTYTLGKAKGNSVSFQDPQIIGYFSYRVPKSPSPDLSLPWDLKSAAKIKNLRALTEDSLVDRANKLLQNNPAK